MKNMLFFVNPAAGKREMRIHLLEVLSRFTAAGYNVVCHPTQKAMEIPEVLSEIGQQFDMIVTCGGDGTLNETVTGLMQLEHRPPLGYIPAGTVNDFAATLHIPQAVPDAVTAILEGEPFSVDLGGFNSRYFAYVAAFGAFTGVSYQTPHASKQALGRKAYLLGGIRALTDIHPIHVVAETGGQTIDDHVILGMITNSTSVAGFRTLDESLVKLDDGLNELILVHAPHAIADYNNLVTGLLSRDYSSEEFRILQVDQVKLHFDAPVAWTLDGEYGGETETAHIFNIPRPIQIMVPKKD